MASYISYAVAMAKKDFRGRPTSVRTDKLSQLSQIILVNCIIRSSTIEITVVRREAERKRVRLDKNRLADHLKIQGCMLARLLTLGAINEQHGVLTSS